MKRAAAVAVACVLCLAVVRAARQAPAASPQEPAQPTFRGGVVVVPVDVRVLDREGKPVTDLKESDFTVFEDGVRQTISHFSTHSFSAITTAPGTKPAVRTRATPPIQEQSARIFLIVLGRGRLQDVSNGLDAVIHLVRQRLLPQDQVAVLAWNRATDFTTDHEKIVAVLERFKKRHEGIENSLQFQLSGLAAVYGSKDIPANLQRDIEEVFRGPGAVASRQITPEPVTDPKQLADDQRRALEASMLADVAGSGVDPLARAAADNPPLPFDAYAAASAQAMQDLGNLYTGIEYLRYLEGEKHLIFVTEQGMHLPRAETENGLAARANNARVAIDTIQTGGLDAGPPPSGRGIMPPIPSTSFTAMDAFGRTVAGQAVQRAYASAGTASISGPNPANTDSQGHAR